MLGTEVAFVSFTDCVVEVEADEELVDIRGLTEPPKETSDLLAALRVVLRTEAPFVSVSVAAEDFDSTWEPAEIWMSVDPPDETWEFLADLETVFCTEVPFVYIVEPAGVPDAVWRLADSWELTVPARDTGVVFFVEVTCELVPLLALVPLSGLVPLSETVDCVEALFILVVVLSAVVFDGHAAARECEPRFTQSDHTTYLAVARAGQYHK